MTKNDSFDVIFFLTGVLFGVFGNIFLAEKGNLFKIIIEVICMSIPAVIYDAGRHPFADKVIK